MHKTKIILGKDLWMIIEISETHGHGWIWIHCIVPGIVTLWWRQSWLKQKSELFNNLIEKNQIKRNRKENI